MHYHETACSIEVFNTMQFCCCLIIEATTVFDTGELQEFCNLEVFRPECWKNEVIVIEEAIYGRRRIGKCIEAEEVARFADDPTILGCHKSVLSLLHAKCSGKKQCEIRIPDADLEKTKPCLKGLQKFLEVRHKCVEGKWKLNRFPQLHNPRNINIALI